MKKHLFILLSLLAGVSLTGYAQTGVLKHCGTFDETYQDYMNTHREARELENKQNEYTQRFVSSGDAAKMPPVIIIPMVFHILHEYGVENISDAQIYNAMEILNKDFRMLNADTTIVVPQFQSIRADCEIEFRLATLDPNGNCTNGINHIYSTQTNIGNNDSKINQWPRDKYLNVWVVKAIESGAAGYSHLPNNVVSNPDIDGVLILQDYVGAIGTGGAGTSRALTHEVGHFLNLLHCWGGTNDPGVACGDDFCGDTPETEGWSSCNLNGSICNPPTIENIQNFMEYAYCSRMFTQDQRDRMQAALSLTGSYPFRANLWQPANLAATGALANPAPTCLPVADFSGIKYYICAGTSITFHDASYRSTPTSWQWSFPGGNPSSSTLQNPTVQYATEGHYDVSLTVTNAAGSNTLVRPYTVYVSNTVAGIMPPVTESFESITLPGYDWFIEDPDGGNSWKMSTTVGKTGSHSIMKNNWTGSFTGRDEFITPAYNMSYLSGASMTFQLAVALKSNPASGVHDELRVLSSYDCGKFWSQRYSKSGLTISTAGFVGNVSFVPTASQWALQSVPLAVATGKPNVRFKFEYTYDVANNIYIDDINILGTVGMDEVQAEQLNLTVSPNPSELSPHVSFTLNESETVTVNVIDMLGRVVEKVEATQLEAGYHEYELTPGMKPGVYIVQLYLGEQLLTKKAVIQ